MDDESVRNEFYAKRDLVQDGLQRAEQEFGDFRKKSEALIELIELKNRALVEARGANTILEETKNSLEDEKKTLLDENTALLDEKNSLAAELERARNEVDGLAGEFILKSVEDGIKSLMDEEERGILVYQSNIASVYLFVALVANANLGRASVEAQENYQNVVAANQALELEKNAAAQNMVDAGVLINDLQQELARVEGERDAARGERDAARGERDAALGERDVALGERNAARGERDAARDERDAARDERDVARGERDAARGERDVAQGERGVAVRGINAARPILVMFVESLRELYGRRQGMVRMMVVAVMVAMMMAISDGLALYFDVKIDKAENNSRACPAPAPAPAVPSHNSDPPLIWNIGSMSCGGLSLFLVLVGTLGEFRHARFDEWVKILLEISIAFLAFLISSIACIHRALPSNNFWKNAADLFGFNKYLHIGHIVCVASVASFVVQVGFLLNNKEERTRTQMQIDELYPVLNHLPAPAPVVNQNNDDGNPDVVDANVDQVNANPHQVAVAVDVDAANVDPADPQPLNNFDPAANIPPPPLPVDQFHVIDMDPHAHA